MNRPIRVMAIGCLLMFVALMLNANYLQYVDAGNLNAKAGNRRVLVDEYSRERGPIVVGGKSIAKSVPSDDEYKYQRRYTHTHLYANLTGYYSFVYGSSGLERSQNGILSGSDPRLFVNRVIDLVSSTSPKGGSVSLTIDPAAQQAAYDGLRKLAGGTQGAVVALDPSTGGVLAMVSTPGYNPNRLASHDFSSASKYYERLLADKKTPTRDRSRQDIFPPGSTFKLVTAAAALSDGDLGLTPDSMVPAGPSLSFPDGGSYQLRNESDAVCGASQLTLTQALDASCNVAFGRLALKVGGPALQAQAEAFGFGDNGYLDGLDVAKSQFTTGDPAKLNGPQTAQSGIGQYNVATTPLQMAMVAAGIANGGTVMKPYIVSQVRSPEAQVLERTTPEVLHDAVSGDVAQELTQMMTDVVAHGTATSVQIPGLLVAGKTGTAQTSTTRNPFAWMVSFAPADNPRVAVAVFIQDASGVARNDISGGGLAGPIAKAVMEAVLRP
ncbi:MAG: peptidoglycan D,D-transpeptidase FtsI family protein [Nocardioidaceae bacterium]